MPKRKCECCLHGRCSFGCVTVRATKSSRQTWHPSVTRTATVPPTTWSPSAASTASPTSPRATQAARGPATWRSQDSPGFWSVSLPPRHTRIIWFLALFFVENLSENRGKSRAQFELCKADGFLTCMWSVTLLAGESVKVLASGFSLPCIVSVAFIVFILFDRTSGYYTACRSCYGYCVCIVLLSFDGIRGCFTACQSCYGYCICIVLLSFDAIRGCFTACQSCYGYCIFIVLLSFDWTTVAATQHVNCVMGTAYSLCSSGLSELAAATQPVSCVISTAYSLYSSHWQNYSGCYTACQLCYKYCIFIVFISLDRTTAAATQPVSCVISTAYSLYSSHWTELQRLLHSLSVVL